VSLHGEAKAAYQLEWMKGRRQAWLLANGPCAECGSWEELEVDHIDPAEKKINPALLWSLSPVNPKRIAELAKCQGLCRTHHRVKTRTYLAVRLGGVRAPTASLTSKKLVQVRALLAAGTGGSEIARQLNISKYAISRVKLRKAYTK
jgi:5-methylcytosine-specific restriction endonuclease McrA